MGTLITIIIIACVLDNVGYVWAFKHKPTFRNCTWRHVPLLWLFYAEPFDDKVDQAEQKRRQ